MEEKQKPTVDGERIKKGWLGTTKGRGGSHLERVKKMRKLERGKVVGGERGRER